MNEALAILAEASSEKPDDVNLYTTALKLLLREKRYADVETCFLAMPESVKQQHEISALQVHARMLQLADQAPPADTLDKQLEETPDNLDTLLKRASVAMIQDDFETALELFLHALRLDRYHDGELPRRAMLAIFKLLGDRHDLTILFQKRMRELLH